MRHKSVVVNGLDLLTEIEKRIPIPAQEGTEGQALKLGPNNTFVWGEAGSEIDESRLLPTGGKNGNLLGFEEGADRGNGNDVRLLLQNALTDSAKGNASPAVVATKGVTLDDKDLAFDGNDSHVTATLPNDLFAADKEWTIDFWMNPTSNSSEWSYVLAENRGDWGNRSIGLTWNSSKKVLEQDTGGYLASVIRSPNWPNDSVACPENEWCFVAVEKQKTSTGWSLNYYRNGSVWLQVAFTGDFVPFDTTNPFWFGGKTDDSGRWFKGLANKIRVTAGARYGGKAFVPPDRLTDYQAPAGLPVWEEGIDRSRLLKTPTQADEGKLPVIKADKTLAVYYDTTLAAIVVEGDKVIDKISGKELTKVGSPQIIDGGIYSPTNSDYYMLELEGVEGLPVAVSFDYQGDESLDNSDIIIINGTCSYYNLNGVSFCRTQGSGNNIKIDNQPIGVSEVYRNYMMQVSSDNYESKTPPVAFIAGEAKSPTYEGSFPAMSPLSSVKICGRFGKIKNVLIGSEFPYTDNFTPHGDGVEGFGTPEKQEPGWNYETLEELAGNRLLPKKPSDGDLIVYGIVPETAAPSGLTSFTSDPNWVVSHSGSYSGRDGWQAFDDDRSSAWCTYEANIGDWLQWEYKGEAGKVLLRRYQIAKAWGNGDCPTSWKIQGSNNGVTWVDLDEQSGQSFPNNEYNEYTIPNNKTPYKFHRFYLLGWNTSNMIGDFKAWSWIDSVDECEGWFLLNQSSLGIDLSNYTGDTISLTASNVFHIRGNILNIGTVSTSEIQIGNNSASTYLNASAEDTFYLRIGSTTAYLNQPGGLARVGLDGKLPASIIPDVSTAAPKRAYIPIPKGDNGVTITEMFVELKFTDTKNFESGAVDVNMTNAAAAMFGVTSVAKDNGSVVPSLVQMTEAGVPVEFFETYLLLDIDYLGSAGLNLLDDSKTYIAAYRWRATLEDDTTNTPWRLLSF